MKNYRIGFAVDTNGVATEVLTTYGAAKAFTTAQFAEAWNAINVEYAKTITDINAVLARFK